MKERKCDEYDGDSVGRGRRHAHEIPSLHKVLHPICGKAMIDYPLDLVRELGVERPVVVVGHGAESVREHIGDGVDFAVQDKSTGWGAPAMR